MSRPDDEQVTAGGQPSAQKIGPSKGLAAWLGEDRDNPIADGGASAAAKPRPKPGPATADAADGAADPPGMPAAEPAAGPAPAKPERSKKARLIGFADRRSGQPGRTMSRWAKVSVAIVILAMVATLAVLNVILLRHRNAVSAMQAARAAAVSSATVRVPEILSYSYKTIDQDISKSTADLTGQFKTDFTALLNTEIKPAALSSQIITQASDVGTSVVSASSTSVTVLVFIDQTTTSQTTKTPQLDGSRVEVTMTKVKGQWLISALTPV